MQYTSDKATVEQQRQSLKAVVARASNKLSKAQEHLDAARENVNNLHEQIEKAEKKLKELPPPHFVPVLKPGSFFPNIYYNDVYNETAGGAVVDRMAQGGLLCENKQDARLISGYLKVMGKLANFALQANRRRTTESQLARTGFIIEPVSGHLVVVFSYGTVLPTFNNREDAEIVLDKHLSENDKRILFQGI